MTSNEISSSKEISKDKDILWDEIGFHKPVAGFWYNLSLGLFEYFVGAVIVGAFFVIFFPFPESDGYVGTIHRSFCNTRCVQKGS